MPKVRREHPSPMGGIVTRSRSEIFLHRTRSGRARPDLAGRKTHRLLPIPPNTAPTGVSPPDEYLGSGDVNRCISIKDLRARRVFSPTSISTECFPDETGKIAAGVNRMDVNHLIDGSEKEGVDEQINSSDVVEVSPGSEPHPGEERVKSTPPDLELLQKLDEGDGRAAAGFNAGSTDPAVKISGNDRQADVTSCQREPGSSSRSKNRLGIAPCSRSKLYRNTSSFAYRRLMPYLMDLAKDRSSGVEILHSHNYPRKVEKNMEERVFSLNQDPSSNHKDHTIGSEGSPTAQFGGNRDVEENPGSENPKLRPHGNVVNDPAVTQSPDSCCEGVLQDQTVMNETPPESSDFEFKLLLKSSNCPPTDHEALSIEELVGNAQALSCLPRKVGEGCRTQVPKLETDRRPALGASQLGSLSPPRECAHAPKKGILKKHSRGCRGICMCLDCVSFRAHAERAFDFSRKQMQEADEVIMGLMNELSCLRNTVEKSVVPVDGRAGNYAVLQSNQEQVKRVCLRAFRVEELAKNHLKQMIHELNIHCRIPGPRVTFAECVEERCTQ